MQNKKASQGRAQILRDINRHLLHRIRQFLELHALNLKRMKL
jgi:hypothetical protein